MRKAKNTLGESLEDCIETILELQEKNGNATVTDISKKLRISKPSVNETINILDEKGLVKYEPYKPITLTRKGKMLAKRVREKHIILHTFLTDVLKIEDKKAEKQACRMEHILEKVVVDRLCLIFKEILKKPNFKLTIKR